MHPGLEDYRKFFDIEGEFDETTLRRVIAAYYGMVSYLDDNIGKLVAALEETGLAAKTRILYTSDHGESMGQKGMMSKCNMYDESVGVPMILAGAGVPRANVVDTPAQLLGRVPDDPRRDRHRADGRGSGASRHVALRSRGAGAEPERVIFSEQHSGGAKSAVYLLRRNGHKYVRYMEPDYPPPALRTS